MDGKKTGKKPFDIDAAIARGVEVVPSWQAEGPTATWKVANAVRDKSRGGGVGRTFAAEGGKGGPVGPQTQRQAYQNPATPSPIGLDGGRRKSFADLVDASGKVVSQMANSRNQSAGVSKTLEHEELVQSGAANVGPKTRRESYHGNYWGHQTDGGRRPATGQSHVSNHYNSAGVGAAFNENANVRDGSSSKPHLLRAKTSPAVAASVVEADKGARVHFSRRSSASDVTGLSNARGRFSDAASSVDYSIAEVGDRTLRRLSDEEQKASTVKVQHLVEKGKFSPEKQVAPESYRKQYDDDTTRSLLSSSDNQRGSLIPPNALPNANYVSSATAADNLAAVRGDKKKLAAAAQK